LNVYLISAFVDKGIARSNTRWFLFIEKF